LRLDWRACFAGLGVLCLPGLASPFLSRMLAGTGGVLEWLIDLAAHWQWLFLAILLPSAVVAASKDRRWVVLLLAAPLPWLSVSAPAVQMPVTPGAATFSVASANVFFRNHDAGRLVRWVARVQPDVVVILELTPAYAEGLKALDGYPHRHVIAQDDAFGIAILSRHPLIQVQELRDAQGIPLVRAKIRWRDRLIGLAALHPMPPQSPYYHVVRNERLRLATGAPAKGDLPRIVAGDFNATPWSNAFTGLAELGWHRTLGLAPTWPASWRGWMGVPIDHVLVNRYWALADSEVGPDIGSDHLPVLARLVLHLPLPRHQPTLELAHHHVEQVGDDTDHDDAHHDDVRAQEVGGVEHHLAKARGRGHHLGGDQRGPAETDRDAHAGEDIRQCRRHDHVAHDLEERCAHRP
jgi:endonuclease/exonuclease/phosphatase (EEP) superfamily protein YafD